MLPAVEQRVTVYGSGSKVAFVAHALTGSSLVAEWWPAIAGERGLLDWRDWRVVGVNALGSCYGSTGPSNVTDGEFPRVTVRDVVRAQRRALGKIGIERFDVAIGGSLGGMQALAWALEFPESVGHAIAIGAHDHQSAMGIALNAVQREAIALDPERGLRLARKIAMLSYKSDDLLRERHGRRADRSGRPRFDVEGYLDHQADRFVSRMEPSSYVALTHAMDSFDLSRWPVRDASPRLTFVGIGSDWLFRPGDVRAAAGRFHDLGFDSRYLEFASEHGHDAFLAEAPALARLLASCLPVEAC